MVRLKSWFKVIMSFSRLDAVVWGVASLLAGLIALVILLGQPAAAEPVLSSLVQNVLLGDVTSEPTVLYLATLENAPSQIFRTAVDAASPPTQLTESSTTIVDFAVSPAGTQIAYSALTSSVGDGEEIAPWQIGLSEIWVMAADGTAPRRVLSCTDASCIEPVWMPDGRRIIYERRNISAEGLPGNSRLWWLDVETGESIPVFDDSQLLGLLATVSPDGRWLSFVSPTEQAIRVINLETGAEKSIPNLIGAAARWRPDSQMIAFADILTTRGQYSMELITLSLATDETHMLTDELDTENNDPVWSPDGAWLAFGRKQANAAMGRQIWIMNAAGTDERQLTNNPDLHHGQIHWSPDGRFLVYQQYNLQELYAKPSVWVIDVQTGEITEIATNASQPAWLP